MQSSKDWNWAKSKFKNMRVTWFQMQMNTLETNPGPQYLPKDKPEFIKAPNYTFGYRRGGNEALKN